MDDQQPIAQETVSGQNVDIVVLKFADSKIPDFKEMNNKEYIYCGQGNDYPEYLIYQYNKCGIHRAIINGKCRYIIGEGLEGAGGWAEMELPDGTKVPASFVNSDGETMVDLLKKAVKDIEIHGGFRWFITWGRDGKIKDIKHCDFHKLRTAKPTPIYNKKNQKIGEKDHGFYFKEKWFNDRGFPNSKEKPVFYPEFEEGGDPKKKGVEIFAYNECGPGTDYYPLPEHIGCANYIDIEIEIGKFHLSAIRNGMMPSKLIQFYTGEPDETKKKQIEKRFKDKFAGSENAGKFILVFNPNQGKAVEVSDLSFNELDKQFDLLERTVQQKLFIGHQCVSPMLFGVKTEGQLGGNTELRTAYEIFINNYAKPKQTNLETVVNYFGKLMEKGNSYKFRQLDPIGLIFDVKDIIADIPKEFIFEKLGIPAKYRPKPALPAPGQPALPGEEQQSAPVNDHVKSLTAKQHQQLMRILRQVDKGQLTKERASVLLSVGLGLTQEYIDTLLAASSEEDEIVTREKFESLVDEEDNKIVEMFSECGDLKDDYHIVKTKKVLFSSDLDAAVDELEFFSKMHFKGELSISEANILDLIAKDKRITPEIIAKTLGVDPSFVTAKIAALTKAGVLTSKVAAIGDDEQVERELTKPLKDLKGPPSSEVEATEILIRYSYEGPRDKRNRPFCAKLLALDRLYSRAEIERISLRLGYSVFDRCGGWWTKPDGTHSPKCRHTWRSNVVVKKKNK